MLPIQDKCQISNHGKEICGYHTFKKRITPIPLIRLELRVTVLQQSGPVTYQFNPKLNGNIDEI